MNEQMENTVQQVAENCIKIFREAASYEEGVQRISEEYQIPKEDILIKPGTVWSGANDLSDESIVENLCSSAVFANNAEAVCSFFAKLQGVIDQIELKLYASSLTNSQNISQNPRLHGFLFEQIHAATYNMRAKLAGKPYIARVLKPADGTYGKNSVDIIIRDTKLGRDVCRYQAKCCQTANDTIQAVKNGNYNNQRLLVPEEQVAEVKAAFPNKTVTSCLDHGGVCSNKTSYSEAKRLQYAIQNNDYSGINWGALSAKDIACAGLQNLKTPLLLDVVMRAGFGVSDKLLFDGGKEWGAVAWDTAKRTLLDTGKLMASTVVKVLLKTKAGVPESLKNIGEQAIYYLVSATFDTAVELIKCGRGEQSIDTAVDHVAKNVVQGAAALAGAKAGASVGTMAGGPVGTVVGAVVGSVLGGLCGSKAGEYVEKAHNEIKNLNNGFEKAGAAAKTKNIQPSYHQMKESRRITV